MNHIQILEQMLSFSMQQHIIKDKTIEELQKKVAEYESAVKAVNTAKTVKETK
jgi:hypothetical protein